MTMLSKLSNESISSNLKKRHAADLIYTYIGDVLVSVNPFKTIPIYGKDHIKQYVNAHPQDLPPHIFMLAERAYKEMLNEEENQCIIISGER